MQGQSGKYPGGGDIGGGGWVGDDVEEMCLMIQRRRRIWRTKYEWWEEVDVD